MIHSVWPVVSQVEIETSSRLLAGELVVPKDATGVVVFAHGSGSSRFSSRNRLVARELQKSRFATLLFDLLTAREEEVDRFRGHLRFDVELLANRLAAAAAWVRASGRTDDLPIGYFGASTGAAAAIVAATYAGAEVSAVVSRGGRPDLAGEALPRIVAPTLLIVGERDSEVLALNEAAYARMRCEKRLAIVPRATHLFEEPGTLEEAARLASDWFARYLQGRAALAGSGTASGSER